MSHCNCAKRFTTHCTSHHGRGARPVRGGLTLLELVVVLGILALLTVVAVQALEPVADQSRYDATVRTLDEIQEAILGARDSRQPDGTPILAGFVEDMGRPPVLQGIDPATQLGELWDTTLETTYPFMSRPGPSTPVNYGDVRLPCGWRGPYLRFDVGKHDLRDGWKMPFVLTADSENVLQEVDWTATPPFEMNVAVSTEPALVTVSGTLTSGGNIPASATVVMLYPDLQANSYELAVATDLDATPQSFEFHDIPIGMRAIVAEIDGARVIRYVYVTQHGLTLSIDSQ